MEGSLEDQLARVARLLYTNSDLTLNLVPIIILTVLAGSFAFLYTRSIDLLDYWASKADGLEIDGGSISGVVDKGIDFLLERRKVWKPASEAYYSQARSAGQDSPYSSMFSNIADFLDSLQPMDSLQTPSIHLGQAQAQAQALGLH